VLDAPAEIELSDALDVLEPPHAARPTATAAAAVRLPSVVREPGRMPAIAPSLGPAGRQARRLWRRVSPMDAETVARELYALRPGEFVAARDAKVAEARRAGERKLAAEIKSMRRPAASAWVMNLFSLQRGERLEQLFSLGAKLREAQASLSGETLRRLDEQRRQVIASLAGEAAALASEHGQKVSGQVVADVEQTLYAALADEDAAASVRGARLTTPLRYTGFGAVASSSARAARPQPDDSGQREDEGVDRRRQEQLRAAERALRSAAEDAEQAEARLAEARARRKQHADAVDRLEAQLADARALLDDAERDVDGGDAAVARTRAALDDARAAADAARTAAANR
jgi:hypothetical protein